MTELHHTIKTNCAELLKELPKHVRLIAASKTRTIEEVRSAFQAGVTNFGENYVQEGVIKAQNLPEATWHFIGHLQSNKVNQAILPFMVFHTVDRLSLLKKLQNAANNHNVSREIYIQVNLANEPQKGGCKLSDLSSLIEEARQCDNLQLVGLMTLPPASENPAPYFEQLCDLAKQYKLPRLSMGMSGDYTCAITHGSTDIRVGSQLFGARKYC